MNFMILNFRDESWLNFYRKSYSNIDFDPGNVCEKNKIGSKLTFVRNLSEKGQLKLVFYIVFRVSCQYFEVLKT